MNYKEFIQKYEELLNSGYCECNELNCLDNNPPKKILNIMKEQQQEIERLNNIINDLLDRQNEALRYIGNHLSLDSRYKHGNGDEELILVRKILNKHTK